MDAVFGSVLRTDVLVATARLAETYPAELASVLDRRPIEVQRAIASLERAGVITTRLVGRTRIVQLNAKFWAADELYALLLKISRLPEYERRWHGARRRRPRAISKPL